MSVKSHSFEYITAIGRRCLFQAGIFSIAVNLLMLTLPIYMLSVFDRVITANSHDTLYFLTIIAIFALVIMGSIEVVRTRLLVRFAMWTDHSLSPVVFDKILSASSLERRASTQLLSDVQDIRNFFSSGAVIQLLDAPWLPVFLLVLFFLHPYVGLLGLIAALGLVGLALLNEFATREPVIKALEFQGRAQREADTSLRINETIKAMGMKNNIVARWMESYLEAISHSRRGNDIARIISAVAKSWRMVVQIAILGLGAYLVLQQEFTPGTMIAGSILLGRALAPVENSIDTWKQLVQVRAARRRLQNFFAQVDREGKGAQRLDLPPPRADLSVRNLLFAYPGTNAPIIRGMSFEIGAGEAVAIIGPSGAGKSTLARLLTGILAPSGGSVRLDDIDITNWPRESIGPYIGYLPQKVELFSGSVAENIGRFCKFDSDDVIKAAKIAGIHQMIADLPQAYETPVGERGQQLSGGETQRLGLARALYGDPVLLVLDEPNSNLDSEGELHLLRVITHLKKQGMTIVYIAHRPNMLQPADRIIYMRNGQLSDIGPRDEILRKVTRPSQTQQITATTSDKGPDGESPKDA